MSTRVKNTSKDFEHGIVKSQIKNYDNDPLVIKKVEKAKETIQRIGFPKVEKK